MAGPQILRGNAGVGAKVELIDVKSEVDLMQVVIQDSYYDEDAGAVADFMQFPVDTIDANADLYSVA